MLRVIVLAYAFGITEGKLADVYNVANTTPNIIYELVLGGILSSIFVPVFVEVRTTRGPRQAWHVARATMTIAIVGLGLLALAAMATSSWIIRLYIHSGTPQERAEAVQLGGQLLAMFMPQIVFYGVGAVMTGLLNANRRFGVPMFAPILNNLTVIAVVLAFHVLVGGRLPGLAGVTAGQRLLLGLGTTAGVVAMTMVQWPFLRRIGFRFRPVLDIVLFWLLPYDWKVAGLAVGHGAGYAVGSVLLLVLLSRRIGGLDGARVLGAVARMLLAGTLMGLAAAEVARTVQRLLAAGFLTDLVTVASSVLAGLVIYLAAAALLRVRELRLLLAVVQRRAVRADT